MKINELFLSFLLLCFITIQGKNNGIIRKLERFEDGENSDESALETDDSFESSDAISEESSNLEESEDVTDVTDIFPSNQTDPIQPLNLPAPLILLAGYGNYAKPHRHYQLYVITFEVYFQRVSGYNILSRRLIFHLILYYNRRLRALQEEGLANCSRISADSEDFIKYNCQCPVDENRPLGSVASRNDFIFENQSNITMDISSFANSTSKDISTQVNPMQPIVLLNHTKLEVYGRRFTLTGKINRHLISNPNEIIMSFDEGDGHLKNATCSIVNPKGDECTLDCNSEESINAPLNGVSGIVPSTGQMLMLYMAENEENILNTGINPNLYKRGSTSGLSGGAIAAIVICVVAALIGIALAVIILKRGGKVPAAPFQESSIGINANNNSQ